MKKVARTNKVYGDKMVEFEINETQMLNLINQLFIERRINEGLTLSEAEDRLVDWYLANGIDLPYDE